MPAIVAAVAGAAAGSFVAGTVLNLAAGSIMRKAATVGTM